MMQNLQLYRGKKGMDTMFDHNEAGHLVVRLAAFQRYCLEELMHQLRLFLEIHELWRQIDPDSPSASRPESFSALTACNRQSCHMAGSSRDIVRFQTTTPGSR